MPALQFSAKRSYLLQENVNKQAEFLQILQYPPLSFSLDLPECADRGFTIEETESWRDDEQAARIIGE